MASRLLRRQVMTLTDAAAARVRELTEAAGKPVAGLRVGIKNGGCAGMSYTMELAETAAAHRRGRRGQGRHAAHRPEGGAVPARLADGLQGGSPLGDLRLLQSQRDLGLRLRRKRRDHPGKPRGASRTGLTFANERRGFEGTLQAVWRCRGQAHVRRRRRLCRGPALRHRAGRRSLPQSRRASQPDFTAAGSSPFIYVARGKAMPTSFWRLPAIARAEADELVRWAALGLRRRAARPKLRQSRNAKAGHGARPKAIARSSPAKRRRRSADEAGPAVAQRDIRAQHNAARRHESGVSKDPVAVPSVFSLQGPVKKANEKAQSEQRLESEPVAKPENEKRDQDAKDHDDQS